MPGSCPKEEGVIGTQAASAKKAPDPEPLSLPTLRRYRFEEPVRRAAEAQRGVGKSNVCLAAQITYHLLSTCTHRPDIGSFSRVVLIVSGW